MSVSSKVLDLFCGMGGLSLGFLLALRGIKVDGLDIDVDAVRTYNFNLSSLGGSAKVGDVLSWTPRGEYDIVIGGPPCQPFSVANTIKRGIDHPLFPTFDKFFDLILELKPRAFVFENVKGLLSRNFRPLLVMQLNRLEKEYRVAVNVLNAVEFGVPQRRVRVFAIGIRKDLNLEPVFPVPTHDEKTWVTVLEAIGDIMFVPPNAGHILDHVMTKKGGLVSMKSEWGSRTMRNDMPAHTITEKHRSGQLIEVPWTKWQEKHPPLDLDLPGRTVTSHISKSWRDLLLPIDGPATTILSDGRLRSRGHHESLSQTCFYRRLTVRECMRLQSFPDWYRFPERVSVSKKFKLVGEAVPPILAYRIAVQVGRTLGYEVKEPDPSLWNLPYFSKAFKRG